MSLTDRYQRACEFKNVLDEDVVERCVRRHYTALNVPFGKMERFNSLTAARAAWAAWAARDARAARAARDARAARAAWDAWAAWATWAAWAAWAAGDARDASWTAAIVLGAEELGVGATVQHQIFVPIFEALEHGLWMYWYTDESFIWLPQPIIHIDERNRPHCGTGAAFILPNESIWFWKGVLVNQQIIEQPDTLTAELILKESNAEVRRVMIERLGLDRFLTRAKAQPIHMDNHRQLYKIVVKDDEPIVAVKVQCPSTGQIYFLRVPPQIDRCDKAVAWTFGFEKVQEYAPLTET